MLASAEREIYALAVTLSAIFLVYVLPMLLAMAGCFLTWRGGDEDTGARLGSLEVIGLGLALLLGFCALEARWPWELHSPWRRHYWLPAGIVALTILGGLRTPMWVLLGIVSAGLWILLHEYAFQLQTDWTDGQHLAMFACVLALAFVTFLGQWKLAEAVPGNVLLVHFGALVGGAALYAFFGASSAKVTQWMTIIGSTFAGVFLLTLCYKRVHLKPTFVLLASWLLVGGLYYGFYSGEQSLLVPLLVLIVAPWSGLLCWKFPSTRSAWIVLGWTGLCLGLAIAAYILTRPGADEDEDDYLDAYGFVTLQFEVVDR